MYRLSQLVNIADRQAHYHFTAKGSQLALHRNIEALFEKRVGFLIRAAS